MNLPPQIQTILRTVKNSVLKPILGEKILQNYSEHGQGISILLAGSFLIGYFGFKYIFLGVVAANYLLTQEKSSTSVNSENGAHLVLEEGSFESATKKEDLRLGKERIITENDQTLIKMDSEQAEWLNQLIKQLWPRIAIHIRRILLENIQPMVREMEPQAILSSFKFQEVTLSSSSRAPRVTNISSYQPKVESNEGQSIILEMDLETDGEVCIECVLEKKILGMVPITIPVGIEDLKIEGQIRIELKPLLNAPPFFGALAISFTQIPKITHNLTGVGNLAEIPGVDGIVKNTINTIFENIFVKDKIRVQMVAPDSDILNESDLKPMDIIHPMPKGCVFVHVKKAEDLVAKDNKKAMGIKLKSGKSDPYIKIMLKNQVQCTDIVLEDLHPVWDEKFCFTVEEPSTEEIKIEAWDYDKGSGQNDDALGDLKVAVNQIYPDNFINQRDGPMNLKHVEHGAVDIDFYWLPVMNSISSKENYNYVHQTIVSIVVVSISNVSEKMLDNTQCLCSITGNTDTKNSPILKPNKKVIFDFEFLYLPKIETNTVFLGNFEKKLEFKNAVGDVYGSAKIEVDCSKLGENISEYRDLSLGEGMVARVGVRVFRAMGEMEYQWCPVPPGTKTKTKEGRVI